MAPDGDLGLNSLIDELAQLFQHQNSYVNPLPDGSSPLESEPNTTQIQAPIRGTFYNSGGFSTSSPNPRHPQGHMGVDMRAAAGTPVYPMTAGVVTNVGSDSKGGNVINIQHDNNIRSYYAHLATVKVQKGQKVDNNTIIGTVGNTGNANVTWPHLHFQVWSNGQIQDPANFFSIPKYTNVDKSKEKWWASEEAHRDAKSFNMQQHLAQRQQAFAHDVHKLSIIVEAYYQLSKVL